MAARVKSGKSGTGHSQCHTLRTCHLDRTLTVPEYIFITRMLKSAVSVMGFYEDPFFLYHIIKEENTFFF